MLKILPALLQNIICRSVVLISLSHFFYTGASAQNFDWAIRGGDGYIQNEGRKLVVDNSDNVIITGYFADSVDFDPGPGTYYLHARGYLDAYVQKLTANGDFVWAKVFQGSNEEQGLIVTTGLNNEVYVGGFFRDTIDLDPGTSVVSKVSNGSEDIFVVKLDSTGNFEWGNTYGSIYLDEVFGLEVTQSGDVLMAGVFYDSLDFDAGTGSYFLTSTNGDFFVEKLDASGNFIWAFSTGASTEGETIYAFKQDSAGNIYAFGDFKGTADFDPGPGVFNMTSVGPIFTNLFIVKYSPSGNFIWATQFGENNTSTEIAPEDIDVNNGHVAISGFFRNQFDADAGPAVQMIYAGVGVAAYVVTLDALNGNYLWAKSITGPGLSQVRSNGVEIDDTGSVYASGLFTNTVDFDPGTGVFSLPSNNFSAFILKLDNAGNFVWAKATRDSLGECFGNDIALNAGGDIYLTGQFAGIHDFDPGAGTYYMSSTGNGFNFSYNFFVLKLSAQPNYIGENASENDFIFYPNPVEDKIIFKWREVFNGDVSINITNTLGQQVLYLNENNINSLPGEEVDVKNLPSGVYNVSVCAGKKRLVGRFVKL